jgi:acetylserotonin N-methyltransferase
VAMSIPDPGPILLLLQAFRHSKVMFAAVALGVFDRLEEAPASSSSLARDLNLSADALERLLDTCVALGLLIRDESQYKNTAAASVYLCLKSPQRITGYVDHSNVALWYLWAHLEDAVREGTHRWEQSFSLPGPIFSSFYRTEAAQREFLMAMHGYGLISSPAVVAAFDLSRFRHLVDVGGGTGHLAIVACQRYPALQATVFDLPSVVPFAQEQIHQCNLSARIKVVAGDFFKDPLPPADLFVLSRIIHDWNEAKIHPFVRKLFKALPEGGGLLISEKLLHPDKTGPLWALLQSLNMLVSTEGKERTLEEYRTTLREAGFRDIEGRVTDSPLDAVLATKLST